MQVNAVEATAIERFALNVTLPIFLEKESTGGLLATGTLFKIDDRAFLITARHVFDDVPDLTKLAYPESPLRGRLFTFGSMNIVRPKEKHIDVAVVELNDVETLSRLAANWQLLSLENVAAVSSSTRDGDFFVSGYPEALTKPEAAGWIKGRLATAYTQLLPNVPDEAEEPVISGLDLFFDYAKDAVSVTGGKLQTPELPGVSGASVWQLRTVRGVWSPEAATRVVGVQSAYVHSKYIRVKSWWAVARVLELVDLRLADAVRSKLDEF